MKEKTLRKLFNFFECLDRDLEYGLAAALAEKIGVSEPDIFNAYEDWQIS